MPELETRTDAIRRALLAELQRRRPLIDENPDLTSVTMTVKLQDGPDPVRSVIYEDQSLRGRRR